MANKPLVLVVDAQIDGLSKSLREGKTVLADFGRSAQDMLADLRDRMGEAANDSGAGAIANQLSSNLQKQMQAMRRAAQEAVSQGKDFDPLGGMNSAGALEAATAYDKMAASLRNRAEASIRAAEAGQGDALTLKQLAVSSEVAAAEFERMGAAMRVQGETFAAVEAQMSGVATAIAPTAAEFAAMAAAADRLRAQLDPMYAAQQRFDQEMTTAETLLANGIIQQHEYAQAVQLATAALQKHHDALFANDTAKPQASAAPEVAVQTGPTAQQLAAMAASANALRGELDPMYAAQKRFDQELTTAEELLANGIITEQEYGAAVTVATQALQKHHDALFNVKGPADGVVDAHNRIGTSSQMLMHSVRAASDSFAAGLPPTMIFAEQISRVSEAMVYAAQESKNTEGAMAKFAGFMTSGWGIAIVAGISVLTTLIGHIDIFGDKVGDAAKKLQEQAEATHLADQAQQIFDGTLDGAIAKERKLTEELDRQLQTRRQIIATQAAGAAQNEIELKSQVEQTRRDYENAKRDRETAAQQPANGEAGRAARDAAVADADRKVTAARDKHYDALTAWQDAQDNTRKAQSIQMQQDAKDRATPQNRKAAELEKRRSELEGQFGLGTISHDQYQAELDEIATQEAENKKTPRTRKPPKDRTPDDSAAYKLLWDSLDTKAASIGGQNDLTIEDRANTARDQVDAWLQKQLDTIAKGAVDHKTWGGPDSDKVKDAGAYATIIANQEKQEIDEKEQRDIASRSIDRQRQALAQQDALLQLQGQLATNLKDRRDIALKLLANQKQSETLAVQKDVNDGKISGPEGDSKIANINARTDLQTDAVKRQTASPIEAYKNQLVASVGDINTALQGIEVSGLTDLEDGFAGIVTQSESADQAVKKMVTSVIGQLAKLAAQQLIFSFLGLSTGGKVAGKVAGKATGGLLGYATGGLPGFAGGTRGANGMISGPGTGTSDSILALINGTKPIMVSNEEGIVNAQAVRNYWPIIDAMNKGTYPKFASGGALGTISYPSLPSADTVRSNGQVVHQYFTVDAKGSILANDLYTSLQAVATQSATVALANAPAMAQQQISDTASQHIPT